MSTKIKIYLLSLLAVCIFLLYVLLMVKQDMLFVMNKDLDNMKYSETEVPINEEIKVDSNRIEIVYSKTFNLHRFVILRVDEQEFLSSTTKAGICPLNKPENWEGEDKIQLLESSKDPLRKYFIIKVYDQEFLVSAVGGICQLN